MRAPYHLIRALLGGLLQLLERGDPPVLLCLVLSEDEDLAGQPHTALLVARDLEDGWHQLGTSVDHVVRGHLRNLEVLIPRQKTTRHSKVGVSRLICWDLINQGTDIHDF